MLQTYKKIAFIGFFCAKRVNRLFCRLNFFNSDTQLEFDEFV